MHAHNEAEGLIHGHPVLLDLETYLEKRKLPPSTITFLGRHAFFAYPRTLWIKLAVDKQKETAGDDIGYRHGLDPQKTGKALGEWLAKKPSIHNIVFDLTDVTIFDSRMLGLFNATVAEPGGGKFFVCPDGVFSGLNSVPGVESRTVFSNERDMLRHLRNVNDDKIRYVPMPTHVRFQSLDNTLKQELGDEDFGSYDVVGFDFSETQDMSFRAHSMLSPIIHSLAHSHGILVTVRGVRPKLLRAITAYGSLRPMRSNFIQITPDLIRRVDYPEGRRGVFGMRTFTADEAVELQELIAKELLELFKYYILWVQSVSKLPDWTYQTKMEAFGTIMEHLRVTVKELVDNVTHHAHGLGYFMMELNPEPREGLRIYIGDTGIGLADGIGDTYSLPHLNSMEAVKMSMHMGDFIDRRRKKKGTAGFGGRGLEHVGVILKKLSATVWVRSGSSMAEYSPAKKDKKDPVETISNLFFVQGTHFHIHIPSQWQAL